MADSSVAITAGSGTEIDTRTEATNGHHRQVIVLGDPSTNAGVAPVDATAGLKVNLGADNDVTLNAGANSIGTLGANSGVDIGDVTINNASGASAVNIQDGGNSITIDALPILVDDAGFSPGSSSVMMAGFEFDDTTPDSVNEGDAGAARMSSRREVYVQLRDAQGNERGLNIDSNNRITVNAVQGGTWTLGANSGVDIGDVTINNASGGSAVNIQDGGNTITVDATQLDIDDLDETADAITAKIATDKIMNDLTALTPKFAPVHIVMSQPTRSGSFTLISGVASNQIRIISGVLLASAAVTVQFRSANNQAASGPIPLGDTGGFQIPFDPTGGVQTVVSQALTMDVSVFKSEPIPVRVGGWLKYIEVQ